MQKKWLLFSCALLSLGQLFAQHFITEKKENSGFAIVGTNQTATIVVDENDEWLIKKTAAFLSTDIESVTGKKITVANFSALSGKHLIIIGSIGNSKALDALVKNMVSPAPVLQKIVGNMGGLLPSYLGPQETGLTISK